MMDLIADLIEKAEVARLASLNLRKALMFIPQETGREPLFADWRASLSRAASAAAEISVEFAERTVHASGTPDVNIWDGHPRANDYD